MEEIGPGPVPLHLRDSTSNAAAARYEDRESYSAEYKYPHDYPGAWVQQQYLPPGMERPHWYSPKKIGFEAQIYDRLNDRESSDSSEKDE
jgi:putative ATPase